MLMGSVDDVVVVGWFSCKYQSGSLSKDRNEFSCYYYSLLQLRTFPFSSRDLHRPVSVTLRIKFPQKSSDQVPTIPAIIDEIDVIG